MKIVTVKYGFTFNRSNYQSERIDLEAQIEPGETMQSAYYELKSRVHDLGGDSHAAQKAKTIADKLRNGTMRIVDEPLPQSNPPYKNDI